ncbi:uncharacterized protein LOC110855366 isoform X1 [Folsomia candida]|nr:uncharacterized protein LOC110855366 isoform X1 [Folsomia candida]
MGGEWWFAFFKDDDDDKTKAEEGKGATSSSTRAPENKGHNHKTAPLRPKFDVKKYQTFLLQVRNRYQHKLRTNVEENYTAKWSQVQQGQEPQNNIFAKFTYPCRRGCGHGENGQEMTNRDGVSTGGWTLYWDPVKEMAEQNRTRQRFSLSDVYARCAPWDFISLSVEVQKTLAQEFRHHFQLYLGDGIGGYGDECDEYWGYKQPEAE